MWEVLSDAREQETKLNFFQPKEEKSEMCQRYMQNVQCIHKVLREELIRFAWWDVGGAACWCGGCYLPTCSAVLLWKGL